MSRKSLDKIYKRRLAPFGPLKVNDPSRFLRRAKKKFEKAFNSPFPFETHLENFEFLFVLAQGSFGKVLLARERSKLTFHAVKAMKKKMLVKKKEITEALNEKKILQGLNCPFCIRLDFFCQDNSHIYFFMPFASAGDLFTQLKRAKRFEEALAKFYMAQLVLAFEYLHQLDLIYRDLKPENILLDHLGYLKLTDFGFAKIVNSRTYTFCGTPDFISPKMIKGRGYGRSVDWWALGVLLFEMVAGYPPFASFNSMERFEKILIATYSTPGYFSSQLRSLVRSLLQVDVTRRLGNLWGGADDVKQHDWLSNVDWYSLFNRKVKPPFSYVPGGPGINTDVFPKLKPFKMLSISGTDRYSEAFIEF